MAAIQPIRTPCPRRALANHKHFRVVVLRLPSKFHVKVQIAGMGSFIGFYCIFARHLSISRSSIRYFVHLGALRTWVALICWTDASRSDRKLKVKRNWKQWPYHRNEMKQRHPKWKVKLIQIEQGLYVFAFLIGFVLCLFLGMLLYMIYIIYYIYMYT